MNKKILISASTHPCPFEDLGAYAHNLKDLGVPYLHCDLMDGKFVDNVALSFDKLIEIGKICDNALDVHLMADNPSEYFDACLEANAEYVTVHYESFKNMSDLKWAINTLRTNGIKAGVSINPGTSVDVLEPILKYIDLVLVMSVVPGKSGQEFILTSVEKISVLNKLRKENNYNYIIEVDGGINASTAHLAINAGADMLVSGAYLFNAQDRKEALQKLK